MNTLVPAYACKYVAVFLGHAICSFTSYVPNLTTLCSINYYVGSMEYEVYCQVGCDILRSEFNYMYHEVLLDIFSPSVIS
jgi:hypothetical protein